MLRDALDEIARVRADHQWLLPPLLESLARSFTVPPPDADTWFSMSQTPTMCPRMIVMAARLKLRLSSDMDPQGRWMTDRGSAMHSMLQEQWLGPTGWIWGGWVCHQCAHLHGGAGEDRWTVTLANAVQMPLECKKCNAKNRRQSPFKYIEPFAIHEKLKVRGRTDGFLRLPAHGFEVMDLKFVSRLDQVRNAPRDDHKLQVHWYCDALNLNAGRLVYMDPAAQKIESAMVEHRIEFDPKLMQKEKEKVSVTREALSDESRPIPACPYGRKGTYGDCACVEISVLWSRSGR